MGVDAQRRRESLVGSSWAPVEFAVDAERIRAYAEVVGEQNPVYHERDAAVAAGHGDVVAPPMFAVVYSFPAVAAAVLDDELEIDLGMLLHGGQRFEWDALVHAGDTIATTVSLSSYERRLWFDFYEFEAISHNQHGDRTARGLWKHVIRLPRPGQATPAAVTVGGSEGPSTERKGRR